MTANRLTQLEDLTRRYARYRPCGAGLGVFWVGALFECYVGLVLGWILAKIPESLTFSEWPGFLGSAHPALPIHLKVATLAVPVLAWLGIYMIQQWVDRRFGRVEGPWPCHSEPGWFGFVRKRFGPVFTSFMVFMYLLMIHFSVPGDSFFTAGAWGTAGLLFIAAWSWFWGLAGRDSLSQGVMLTISLPAIVLLGTTNMDLMRVIIILGLYAVLTLCYVVKGALRYIQFSRVSHELDRIRPEDE